MADSMENVTTLIDKTVNEMNQMKTRYQAQMQAEAKKIFKILFDKHEYVDSIVWTQYTPYFNDGEACYFGVNEFTATPTKMNEVSEEHRIGTDDWYDSWDLRSELNDVAESLDKPNDYYWFEETQEDAIDKDLDVLNKIPDEVFEQMFGDHVKVTATRAGFEVEEFAHD